MHGGVPIHLQNNVVALDDTLVIAVTADLPVLAPISAIGQ